MSINKTSTSYYSKWSQDCYKQFATCTTGQKKNVFSKIPLAVLLKITVIESYWQFVSVISSYFPNEHTNKSSK